MDGLPQELCFPALANDLANSIRNSFSGIDVTRAVLQSFLYRSQALITDISRTHVNIGKYHLFDLLGPIDVEKKPPTCTAWGNAREADPATNYRVETYKKQLMSFAID
ncbi:unnamed protein product [Acanthoscelides obtectus]|uniref:Uncharacterized protein n=1 Tax=Acanthoscelides obtectus TaxID=200917 RepID=A0A9P0MFC6_ACAOB|nr:unnamed protein product [Acanthoscelides obtectus]CAK1636399.1 hypothetical protein AOBTE_LOCUS9833 [Acanthoscelides obtectus]